MSLQGELQVVVSKKRNSVQIEKIDQESDVDTQYLNSPPNLSAFETSEIEAQAQRNKKSSELFKIMEKASGKNLLICIKGYPDPDSIGSALALQWIASNFKITSQIMYFDEISHHENRALVKKLDIDMVHWSDKFDLSKFDYFAVNDAQSPDLPIKLPESMKLLVFVDHHRMLPKIQSEFVDVREDAGSTSAIYCEYLMSSREPFTGESEEEGKIASALMHGIRTDTDDFVNAQPIDFLGSQFLSRKVDKDILALISKQSIPAKTMDLTAVALQHKDIRETFLFAGVGYVREEDRDGIGQCADYLLHREGIETVVVYGVVGNSVVDGSLRTRSHTVDPDKWLKDVFGQDKDGHWYGGGRKDKGGFQIPLGLFSKCSDRELLWILIKKTIDELFYAKIGIGSGSSRDSDFASGKV